MAAGCACAEDKTRDRDPRQRRRRCRLEQADDVHARRQSARGRPLGGDPFISSQGERLAALQLPFAIGYVSLIGAVLVMPTSLLTAPLGVRAAHAMSRRMLEIAFGCYLFLAGGRFVISLLYGQ